MVRALELSAVEHAWLRASGLLLQDVATRSCSQSSARESDTTVFQLLVVGGRAICRSAKSKSILSKSHLLQGLASPVESWMSDRNAVIAEETFELSAIEHAWLGASGLFLQPVTTASRG